MGTPRIRSLVVVGLLAAAGAAGCGGPQGPTPLSRRFDDSFLAQLPIDQRQEEIAAKQQYEIAILERDKAKADLAEAETAVKVARNDRDAAKKDEDSAKLRQKEATASADMNRVSKSETELKAASAAREAAEKRFEYLNAYKAWLRELHIYTQYNVFWKEAQYELAQAKLAQKNNIQPSGFKPDDYAKQEQDKGRRAEDAKKRAESKKSSAMDARTAWVSHQKSADKLLGRTSDYPDPMKPGGVKGVDPSLGGGVETMGGSGAESDKEIQPTQDPTMKSDGEGQDDGGESDGAGEGG